MLRSMTGFASGTGTFAPYSWSWELRAVNGKGQDLRLRVPDWIDGLEVQLRKKLGEHIERGNVTLILRVTREDTAQAARVNETQLKAVLAALAEIEKQAKDTGVSLTPATTAEVAAFRGVMETTVEDEDLAALTTKLVSEAEGLIADLNAMRASEGAALKTVLDGQLAEIEERVTEAESLSAARIAATRATLQRNLARVLENVDGVDEGRLLQELALIAVKADVTEEIDRLRTHLAAARDLISKGSGAGRKLVFLVQEFMREANTLCAKSQNAELTRCGLALKSVIDQMREQVQNVE